MHMHPSSSWLFDKECLYLSIVFIPNAEVWAVMRFTGVIEECLDDWALHNKSTSFLPFQTIFKQKLSSLLISFLEGWTEHRHLLHLRTCLKIDEDQEPLSMVGRFDNGLAISNMPRKYPQSRKFWHWWLVFMMQVHPNNVWHHLIC